MRSELRYADILHRALSATELNGSLLITNRFPTSSLLFRLILLIGGEAAHAQYRFDHWTTDNGLPQNSVHGILQTRHGYMWFTTFDGLVRFDGLRFTVFNKSNSPGLAGNGFRMAYEDRFGDLWVELETGGLVRMHQGRFTTYTKGQGLEFDGDHRLFSDGQGNMIILRLRDMHLFRWSEGRFQPVELPLSTLQTPDEESDRLPQCNVGTMTAG